MSACFVCSNHFQMTEASLCDHSGRQVNCHLAKRVILRSISCEQNERAIQAIHNRQLFVVKA